MQFEKLIKGKLLKRYKRFLADIILENKEIITAHVPNSGAMTSCIEENCDVWLTFHDNPKRKLKYTLELTLINENLICTNTGAYADHIRTASRLTSGHSAEVDSYTLPIYIRTI